jgi:hypothetical protein
MRHFLRTVGDSTALFVDLLICVSIENHEPAEQFLIRDARFLRRRSRPTGCRNASTPVVTGHLPRATRAERRAWSGVHAGSRTGQDRGRQGQDGSEAHASSMRSLRSFSYASSVGGIAILFSCALARLVSSWGLSAQLLFFLCWDVL